MRFFWSRVTAKGVSDSSTDADDCIQIKQLEVEARVGVTENEQRSPQRLVLTITMWPRHSFEALGDNIGQTANYSEVVAATAKFASNQSSSLIETLASELAAHLLQTFPLRKVTIELRKFVLPQAKHVAVFVTRSAGDGAKKRDRGNPQRAP